MKYLSILAAAGIFASAIAGCAEQSSNSSNANSDLKNGEKIPKVALAITEKGCEPSDISVASGKTIFVITNKSSQPQELYILDGVKVLEERENIVPGFVVELKAELAAGEYQMGCGSRNNAKGKITVTGDAKKSEVPAELVAPLAAYKDYVNAEADQLVIQTKTFTDAVIAGDLAQAQKLYPIARVNWERIEPVADLFADLDASIDKRVDDFEKKELDPKFTGFHRLEFALFNQKSTQNTKEIAQKLMADTLDLQDRIKKLDIEPKDMVGGAQKLIEEVAAKKISGEEDRYSHTDLWDFKANIEGSQKIVELLRPLLQSKNPELLKRVDATFVEVNQGLNKYKTTDGGFGSYEKLTEADRKSLKALITMLAEDLSKLRGILEIG